VPPEARATIVVDSEDDPTFADALSARASPPGGVVVVRPVPGVSELNHLAADLLIGLGKRFDALAREKQSRRAWVLATVWLQAERTRHVVVVDADRLPPSAWLAMTAFAQTTAAHVWFIASTQPPSPGQSKAAGTPPRVALADFLAALPVAARPEPVRLEGPLPGDDFLTFRASCRELLPMERFGVVDRVYRRFFVDTFNALTRLRRAGRRPSEQWVLDHLRQAVSTASGPNETLVRLRAAQAACFRLGLLVNLVPSLRPLPVSIPSAGLTPEGSGGSSHRSCALRQPWRLRTRTWTPRS
jgi:hypothetical protein